jgi:hypothetical protein
MAQIRGAPPLDDGTVDRMAPASLISPAEIAPPAAVDGLPGATASPAQLGDDAAPAAGARPRLSWTPADELAAASAPPLDVGELAPVTASPPGEGVPPQSAPPSQVEGRWVAPPGSVYSGSAYPAPPPPGPAPASPAPASHTTMDVIAAVRLMSAEAQDLRAVLRKVRDGEAPMASFAGYVHTTRAQMEAILAQVADIDDCFRHMRNTWELISASRIMQNPEEELPAQELMQGLGLLDGYCRQLVYWAATRTVPARLKDWLRNSEPGYAIPFHAVFEDEVPDAEDRQKILNQLAWSPVFLKDVGGIVDPESGLVYRYDTDKSRWEMSLAFVWIVVAVAVGAGVVAGLAELPPLSPGAVPASLVLGWGAMLAGTIVHWVIGANKRLRGQQGTAGVLPIGRSLILLNAQIGFVLLRIAVALVGYVGLMFTVGSNEFTTFAFNAFLAGYSLDSVVELFGSSMDQRAAAQNANLKQQMGVR